MRENNIWKRAQTVKLQVAQHIPSGFDIGFDKHIPQDVQAQLCAFMEWVETNYSIPITLWVDFEYKHYVIRRDGKRVGYLFYWSDLSSYPAFDNSEDIPMIRLPVRTEHSTMKEILLSFIEAISYYYAWICNELNDQYELNNADADAILQEYLCFCELGVKSEQSNWTVDLTPNFFGSTMRIFIGAG